LRDLILIPEHKKKKIHEEDERKKKKKKRQYNAILKLIKIATGLSKK